ncbi:magnesium transporter CorA family protein [Sphingomonas sp. URHD0057]|uniref:magnesium transporter CorA family protein n=1 Tax=Sphingomonas sp. URHD0057 TaxID=1380389 RepID=UPI00048F67B9|nr:magnesium transporter CorA family protein [Sphingomonas sp. URHD0057]
MLRTYGPGCDGSVIDPEVERIPDGATWIDLEEPTKQEEALVERCIQVGIPTEDEMKEIEPSSRLYERDGVLYMTVSVLYGVADGAPSTTPVGFVLANGRLVTIRYATPKPVLAFAGHVQREPGLARDSVTVLVRLLDAIIDRLADELENVGAEIEQISSHIFARDLEARRIPATRLTALLTRIGRAQTLLAKIRYSAVSSNRMLSFLGGSNLMHAKEQVDARHHLTSLTTDITSLSEHSSFLSDNLTFLLDASLGLISIEQNAAMKLFSWAAVVFLPPTLVAGIFGMNFHHMPELEWMWGYPASLVLMLASMILPYLYFKRRGWI